MKFCRRTEGAPAARAVFKKAREDPKSGFRELLISLSLYDDVTVMRNLFQMYTWLLHLWNFIAPRSQKLQSTFSNWE